MPFQKLAKVDMVQQLREVGPPEQIDHSTRHGASSHPIPMAMKRAGEAFPVPAQQDVRPAGRFSSRRTPARRSKARLHALPLGEDQRDVKNTRRNPSLAQAPKKLARLSLHNCRLPGATVRSQTSNPGWFGGAHAGARPVSLEFHSTSGAPSHPHDLSSRSSGTHERRRARLLRSDLAPPSGYASSHCQPKQVTSGPHCFYAEHDAVRNIGTSH